MSRTPVLLLKTKSSPSDAYEELLSTQFEPTFVPVLKHRFEDEGLASLRALLQAQKIGRGSGSTYGGLIFTSQRAVEAFTRLVDEGHGASPDGEWPHLQGIPVYSVGPATTRALAAIRQSPPLNIFGGHTGNGDALARFILEHYHDWYSGRPTKPPLLFLVGEQRRDIIPKTLMSPALPPDRRIEVTETVVYGTGEMETFPRDFASVLASTADRPMRWVAVFSPTGCDSMLKELGMLDGDTGRVAEPGRPRSSYIVTIGPTTRAYLRETFDFEADASAETPSAHGLLRAITSFVQGEHQQL